MVVASIKNALAIALEGVIAMLLNIKMINKAGLSLIE